MPIKREIPFRERIACRIDEASIATGLGRSTIYEMIQKKEIESDLVNGCRLIKISSLLKVIEGVSKEVA